MDVFVGEQARFHFARGVVNQTALVDAAVVGFVVLQAEVRDVIAQAEQEVVIAVMMRAEKLVRLFDQVLIVVPDLLRRGQRGGTVGSNVHFSQRIVGEFYHLEKLASDHGRI